jgi:hypothetical protein
MPQYILVPVSDFSWFEALINGASTLIGALIGGGMSFLVARWQFDRQTRVQEERVLQHLRARWRIILNNIEQAENTESRMAAWAALRVLILEHWELMDLNPPFRDLFTKHMEKIASGKPDWAEMRNDLSGFTLEKIRFR